MMMKNVGARAEILPLRIRRQNEPRRVTHFLFVVGFQGKNSSGQRQFMKNDEQ